MKTVNFTKSETYQFRRKIVIAEINILINLDHNHMINAKIVREMGKLHSLWFSGTAKDMRIAELQDNRNNKYLNLIQPLSPE
jgi:hypothetical protein